MNSSIYFNCKWDKIVFGKLFLGERRYILLLECNTFLERLDILLCASSSSPIFIHMGEVECWKLNFCPQVIRLFLGYYNNIENMTSVFDSHVLRWSSEPGMQSDYRDTGHYLYPDRPL